MLSRPGTGCLIRQATEGERQKNTQTSVENRKCRLWNLARRVLCQKAMSHFESSDKMVPPFGPNGGENHQEINQPDSNGHISLTLAHQLNNDLTVVQGHADRLLAKHQEDPALAPGLKSISEAARRATQLIRKAPKFDAAPPSA